MVTSLLKYERIRTTKAKAKGLRKWADHLITLAKKGDLHSRRQVLSIVREKKVVHQLFEDANTRYGDRAGGHTRIVKLGRRPGDAAPMALIELIAKEKKEITKPGKKKTETAKEEALAAGKKEAGKEKKPEAAKAAEKPAAKKKTSVQKAAPKKKVAKTKGKEKEAEAKKEKPAGKKKAVRAKKKAAPKKASPKEEKKEK